MTAARCRPVVLLALACAAASCGPPRYLPFRIIEPHGSDGVTARLDSLTFQLRVGEEWLELRIENKGSVPRAVDFGQLSFVSAGIAHELVTQRRLGLDLMTPMSMDAPLNDLASARYSAFRPHVRPPLLQIAQPEAHIIAPGEYVDELLYPVEHLLLESVRFSAGPLFCHNSQAERRFEVIVPVLYQDVWVPFTIVAERLPPEATVR